MRIVGVIIGFGVEVREGVVVTHKVEIKNKKLSKEIQKIIEKYESLEELFNKKERL